jgi:hypothetical protein
VCPRRSTPCHNTEVTKFIVGLPHFLLRLFVEIAKDLVEVRRAFQVLGPDEQRQTFRQLQRHEANIPKELQEEIKCIGCEVDFRECMTLLEKGLRLPSPVRYFIPSSGVSLKANRRQSQGQLVRSSSLLISGDPSTNPLLDEEELIPNPDILTANTLSDGLEIASRLQKSYTDSTLSPYLISLIETATLILQLRNAVLNEDWKLSEGIVHEIEKTKLVDEAMKSLIQPEYLEAKQVIQNSLVITLCESALQSNQSLPSEVDIGFLDLSHTSLTQLNEAIEVCEETQNKSKRADFLYSTLLLIKDLRRSVLTGDWSAIKMILNQLRQQGAAHLMTKNSRGTFPLCGIEIESVRIAAINQEALKSLKLSLLEELVQGLPGAINVETIETYKLTASLGTVISVPIHDRGEFLSNFFHLSDLILKGRKSVQAQQWNVLRNLSTMWKEKLIQIKTKSYEIFEDLNSGVYGTDNSKSVNLQFPLKDYEYLYDLLLEERDLLQNHVTMIQLEGEVSKVLLENGVSSDMVGQIDLSKIRIDGLQVVLERKDNLLKATKSTLPGPVEKLCKAAHLMLDIRSAILKGFWEKVPGLLEEALTGPYHPLPQACQQEINVIRLECENRWIINSLTVALESNCLSGTVDDFKDTSDVSTEQLKGAIAACYTLTPRTDEAISLLRTAEDILKLRSLLIEGESDWTAAREMAAYLYHKEHMHQLGIPEVHLVWIIADNILLCQMMQDELTKNATSGRPGNLDLSQVDTRGLTAACQIAIETSVKSKKANQLLYACRSVLALREALLRAASYPESASDALNTVKSIVYSMYEVHTKNPRDAGWLLCRNEVWLTY